MNRRSESSCLSLREVGDGRRIFFFWDALMSQREGVRYPIQYIKAKRLSSESSEFKPKLAND